MVPSHIHDRQPPAQTGVAIVILAALTGLTPLATDMYIPAFPAMASELSATGSAIQSSIAAYMLGLVLGQLLLGPISDRTGRRTLLIAGAWLFALFSAICALAPDAGVLVAVRWLQGVAAAVGMVLARAVIGDWYHGPDAAKRFSALTMIVAVAPILAPVLGGLLLRIGSWRLIFAALAVLGVLLALATQARVPESLPPERRHGGSLAGVFRTMAALLKQRAFVGYALVFACSTVALFAYLAAASFVFQGLFGLSEWTTSLLFGLNALGMLAGGVLFGALSRKTHLHSFLIVGVVLGVMAAAVQWLLAGVLGATLVALFFAMLALGLLYPASMAAGQAAAPHAPGGASALLGAGQCLFGAIAAPLVGLFGTSSARPMAALMIAGFALAGLALLLLVRPWHAQDSASITPGG
ncbi:MAG: Bcr/CflA family efflux MFS transporter [Comamonas sp.]